MPESGTMEQTMRPATRLALMRRFLTTSKKRGLEAWISNSSATSRSVSFNHSLHPPMSLQSFQTERSKEPKKLVHSELKT